MNRELHTHVKSKDVEEETYKYVYGNDFFYLVWF